MNFGIGSRRRLQGARIPEQTFPELSPESITRVEGDLYQRRKDRYEEEE